MNNARRLRGFTLIEVMVALAVIVVMATTVLGVQMTMIRTTARATGVFERLWHMVTFLRKTEMEATIPKSESFEKRAKVGSPALELVCTIKRPSKKSKLSVYKDLFIERVDGTWANEQNRKNSDALITFLYRPKEAEKEKAAPTDSAVNTKTGTESQKTSADK